jgi:hypothetical protein
MVIIWIIIWIFFSVWISKINNVNLKSNVIEIKKEVIEKTPWEIFSEREIIINNKIDFELKYQKNKRDEINKSVEKVKLYKIQKEEIEKQKIEIAQ